jgi:hypothetical protein
MLITTVKQETNNKAGKVVKLENNSKAGEQ